MVDENAVPSTLKSSKKGHKFWLIFASMCTCLFLSHLEVCSVSTALPTIANALHASQFTWIGAAYNLAGTVFHTIGAGMAQSYGRRPAFQVTLALFAIGSSICGAADSMTMLVAGRTIQGLGGGGIQSLTRIVLSDIVTLQERGFYIALFSCVECIAAAIGPVIGGSLASSGQWRWLFYMNLPMSLIALGSSMFLRDLPIPPGSAREKFMRMDWIGNFLVVSSTVACTIGLTWGGVSAPWDSATVLVPLILGLVVLVVFVVYEAIYATHPLVPFSLMTNRTSISGYIQLFCVSAIIMDVVYFLPIYFQACKSASPVMSGVYAMGFLSFVLFAFVSGVSIGVTQRYRPQIWFGWAVGIVGFGLASTVLATDALGKMIGIFVVVGVGTGVLSAAEIYPIQAPLSVTQNASAVGFMSFVSSFATTWGITIGGTVVQNVLARALPAPFIHAFPQGTAFAYALIPDISALDPETRVAVQAAFAQSLAALWRAMAGVCGVGLVASMFMRGLPLPNLLDSEWTVKEGEVDRKEDSEDAERNHRMAFAP